jgi:putative FmdB family regulatory protein
MPKYAYRCSECENEFEIYHSINDKLKNCEPCESVETLIRIPSLTIKVVKKVNNNTKVGEVVNSHIEDARQELKKEKEKLKKVTYKPKK